MVTSDYALRCHGVTKTFGSVRALDNLNIDLARGSVLALLGPSGCGKTTALRIIAGLEAPDSGTVEIGGQLVTGPGVNVPPEKRRAGMVFQDYALFPHLSVRGNIAYGLSRGARKEERLAELVRLVGLDGLEDRMPHELSGGQQQRVALARALAAEPALILLDEPFSNLDPSIRERVRTEVKQLIHTIGITAVFVTHDQEEALSLAEQVAVMIEGRVLQTGSPSEVYLNPIDRAVGEFVGNPNFLRGLAADGFVETELGRIEVDAGFVGPADIMVRSENLTMSDHGAAGEVVGVEYFGHDQMITVRLGSGTRLRIRLLAGPRVDLGQKVGVQVNGDVFAFPARK